MIKLFLKSLFFCALILTSKIIFAYPNGKTDCSLYNAAKYGSTLAKDLGLTNTDVVESITSNFTDNLSNLGKETSKETTVTNNDRGNGEGVASLENQASNYNEYILLLQKLQAGTISDAERNRYNVLKNMLGI